MDNLLFGFKRIQMQFMKDLKMKVKKNKNIPPENEGMFHEHCFCKGTDFFKKCCICGIREESLIYIRKYVKGI